MALFLILILSWLGYSFVYFWFLPIETFSTLNLCLIPAWIALGLITMTIITIILFYFITWILGFLPANSKFRGRFAKFICDFLLVLYNTKVDAIDLEKMSKDTPTFFVANHKSQMDPIFMFKYIHGPFCIAAKSTLYVGPVKPLFKGYQVLSIYREDDRKTVKSILQGIKYMSNGANGILFPEGGIKTRETEQMVEIKPGAYKLATKTNATIQPMVIYGSSKVGKMRLFQRKHVTIKFLDPIKPEEYKDLDTRDIALMVFDLVNKEFPNEETIKYDPDNKAY